MKTKSNENKRVKNIGLTIKILCIALVPVLAIGLLLTILSAVMNRISLTSSYSDEAMSLTNAYADSIEKLVNDLDEEFNYVTMNGDIVDENISLDDRKVLLNELASMSTFKDFAIAYSDGKTYNDTDISQREYFIKAMENKGAYVSSPVLRMTDNTLTIMMGKYFSANGKDYLAYGGLSTDIFNEVIANVHFGDGGFAYVIDKDGQIIASSNTDMFPTLTALKGDAVEDEFKDLMDVTETMLTYVQGDEEVTIHGESYFMGYAPIEGVEDWSIAVGTPEAAMNNAILLAQLFFIGVVLICMMIITPIVIVFVRKLCKPIVACADRLQAFSDGDISTPAPTCSTKDEVQSMTDSLGIMITTLDNYIGDIRNVLTAISEGNLTVSPAVEYKGDFTEIKDALDLILTSLRQTMAEVGQSADEVKMGAEQLAEGSSSLSQNAIVQASAVDEITSTLVDIAKKSEENNRNVSKALESSNSTNAQAQDGSRSMQELLQAITEIEESSKEIEHIIQVIDDIAFQTNILSLNAAIEAARAGDAGKGFAVVADEVRNLASKSSDAAKQTGLLINRSIEAVNRGTELAHTASEALEGIVNGVEDVSQIMNEISSATVEQTNAVEQVSSGMETANAAIHTTSATAEESAASSEELSALAVSLTDIVNRFKF